MQTLQQLLTTLTAIVMTLSGQVGNLSKHINYQGQLAQTFQTPLFVQGASGDTFGPSVSASFSNSSSPGNLIAVYVGWQGTTLNLSNVTSSCVSGGFTLLNNPTTATGLGRGTIGYGVITASSAPCTITATFSGGSSQILILAHEISGIDNSFPIDSFVIGVQNAPGTGIDAVTTGNITTSANGDYLFGATYSPNGSAITTGTNFNQRLYTATNANRRAMSEDKIQNLAGPISINFTGGTGYVTWITGAIAFRSASSPTPPILSAPIISSFSSSPPSIQNGQSSTLSWSVSGNPTPTLSINPGNINPSTSSGSTSVSPSQTTTYTLSASNSQGSVNANTTITVTAPPLPDTTPPSTPTNLIAAAISSSQINLSWTASTDAVGVTGYKIYRGGTQIGTSTSNGYSDNNLSPSTSYFYTVQAYDAASNISSQSSSVSATTQSNVPLPSGNYPWSNIISSDRAIDWSKVGASTIPNRTTICATLNPGATATQINSAIQACPNGQVVKLNAGTYNISSSIIPKSNVTLRGTGMGSTIIAGSTGFSGDGLIGSGNIGNWYLNDQTSYNLVSPQKGDTIIITASNHNWSVGDYIQIDQLEDLTGSTIISATSSQQPNSSGSCRNPSVSCRPVGQTVRIASIPASNQAVINTPLYWTYNKTPQATKISSFRTGMGFEDFTLDNTTSNNGKIIHFGGAIESWILRVEMIGVQTYGLFMYGNYKNTIRSSKFHEGYAGSGGGYTIMLWNRASENLFEDNIIYNIGETVLMDGSVSGNVIAYNYSTAPVYGGNSAGTSFGSHAAHPMFNLFEGNQTEGRFRFDYTWGTNSHQTMFRNRLINETNLAYNAVRNLVDLWAYARYMNVIGNVLGTVGQETIYQETSGPVNSSAKVVYAFGETSLWGNRGVDPNVLSTVFRQGNWDSVTNSIRWDEDIINSTRILPASFYLSSRPSWYGNCTWPAFGPDLTPMSNDIPAKRRFEGNSCGGLPLTTYTITSSTGGGGTISPSGTTSVNSGGSQTYTFTPNTGYRVASVTVDGTSQGSTSSYSFNNITTNHTISVSFSLITPIVGDFNNDGLVNSIDLSLMISAWNTSNSTYDLNHDSIINSLDYAILSNNWTL